MQKNYFVAGNREYFFALCKWILKHIEMKRLLIFIVLMLAFSGVYSQSASVVPDNRLYSKFQTSDINNMVEKLPSEIVYWNWFVDNGFEIKRTSPEVAQKYPPLKFIDKDTKLAGEEEVAYDEANFNILAYDFEVLQDRTTVYRIGNTGYIVNILSDRELVKKYNKSLSHE